MSQSIRRYTWNGADPSPLPTHTRAVALGIFDGLHIGHRAVIAQTVGIVPPKQKRPLTATVVTLSSPDTFKADHTDPLLSDRQRRDVWLTLGIDEWIEVDFDTVRHWSPERFVRDFLVGVLHAKRVCCGFNYRFGHNGCGDTAQLQALGAAYGIEVIVVPPVLVDGEPVSTHRIRSLLAEGDLPAAARLWGRLYTVRARVVHGQRRGGQWGIPTVNQFLPARTVWPRFGAYASVIDIDGCLYRGVTNVGTHPTVGSSRPQAETWIDAFDGTLYGRTVTVTLLRFLRPERTFSSVQALTAQIHDDRRLALAPAPAGLQAVLFDFDDTLQDRETAFSAFATRLFSRYAPHLPTEEIARRAEEMRRLNGGGYVHYPTFFGQVRQLNADIALPSVTTLVGLFQRQFPSSTSPLPDAADTLRELRRRGYRLAVITNGYSLMQNRKLDYSGLRPWFDFIVVGDEEPAAKPAVSIFRRAAARLQVACDQCVYIGDHPVNDVQGALQAGMHALCSAVTHEPPASLPPVPVIHHLRELLTLLPAAGDTFPADPAEKF